MLRTLFIGVFLWLYILVVGPPLLLYTFITRDPDPIYWAGVKGVMFFVCAVGVKVRVKGLERIPPDGRLQEFKKGAVMMAIKAGVPIVPMVCAGAHRVMEKHSLVIHPGEIVVEFLEPIDASKYSLEERDILNERLRIAMGGALPPDQRPAGLSS